MHSKREYQKKHKNHEQKTQDLEVCVNYLCSKVLQDSSEVDRSASADALGVFASFEEASDPANGELKAGFVRSGHGLGGCSLAAAAGAHGGMEWKGMERREAK